MRHHAYGIYGELHDTTERAIKFIERTHNIVSAGNPDFEVLTYDIFSIADARALFARCALAPLIDDTKVHIIVVKRIYGEAQNAILKLLEEPPLGVIIVIVIAHATMLIPTVLSRLATISSGLELEDEVAIVNPDIIKVKEAVHVFLKNNKDERIAYIKKAFTAKTIKPHLLRENSILFLDLLEKFVYEEHNNTSDSSVKDTLWKALEDIETVRQYLYEKVTQARMLFEHLALVIPIINV